MQTLLILMMLFRGDASPSEPLDVDALLRKNAEEKLAQPVRRVDRQRFQAYLQAVQKDRDPKVLRLLVDQYVDFQIMPERLATTAELYPVVGVFADLGLKYVPFLLDRIKEIDPNDNSEQTAQKRRCLLWCIEAIYDKSGDGLAMAIERIRLEIGKTQGRERESLKKCLPNREEEPSTAATPRP